jgi:drug/metabolite transporter (DMT)-like permease
MDLSNVSPMLFVVTGVATLTCINLTNRKAVHSTKTLWGVIAANYCTALTLSAVIFYFGGSYTASTFTLMLGFATGFLYTGGMFLGMTTIGRRGASISASTNQLSVIIPVGLSITLFGESLGLNQLAGAVLALISLPLLAAKAGQKNLGSMDRGTLILLATQLFVQGFAQFSSKVLVASGLGVERNAFFLAVFTSATLVTLPLALRHREEIKPPDFAYGLVVGICNIGGNLSILLALISLPGAIVFPFVNSGGLLLVTILVWLIFKERISRVNALGIALTLAAVLLINL